MIEALLVFALALGLGWPLGRYLAAVMRGDTRLAADPQKAFARSLLYPGLGHAMLGYSIDGFARGAVFALAVVIAIFLPLSAARFRRLSN